MMSWKYLFQIAVASGLLLAQTIKTANVASITSTGKAPAGVAIDEILSYECGKSLASIVSPSEQTGPLFNDGRLIFTSLEAQDGSKILLVSAGYGNFAVHLEGDGVNRIRFELPTSATGPARTFFLSYMHGGALRSRYFEYSENHAPPGRDELDYSLVPARRADNLMAHLSYAIHETAEATLSVVTEGKVTRSEMARHRVESCDFLTRQAPNLASNVRRNVDQLELIVMGLKAPSAVANVETAKGARSPASVTAAKIEAVDPATPAALLK